LVVALSGGRNRDMRGMLPFLKTKRKIAAAFSLLFFYGKRLRNDICFILNASSRPFPSPGRGNQNQYKQPPYTLVVTLSGGRNRDMRGCCHFQRQTGRLPQPFFFYFFRGNPDSYRDAMTSVLF
jgi:hypothetical protein